MVKPNKKNNEVKTDQVFILLYMIYVENYREDIMPIHLKLLPTPWYIENLKNNFKDLNLNNIKTYYFKSTKSYYNNIEKSKNLIIENNKQRSIYIITNNPKKNMNLNLTKL